MREFIVWMWNCPAPIFVIVVLALLVALGMIYDLFYKSNEK